MKRLAGALLLFAALAADLSAQPNPLVIYAEGKADVQDVKGVRRKAETGAYVFVDETLITGKGGRIQLQSRDGTFDVRENTVLKLMQAQTGGRKQNAYIVALGRVNMKVSKLSSGEPAPRLGSSTAAAGVKGTELDVYEGADGSSLILVTEGQVDVESNGQTVSLNPNEAVEVKPGQAPGEKFVVRNPIDYSQWNEGKFEEFMKDPVGAAARVESEIKAYAIEIKALYDEYQKLVQKAKAEEAKLPDIEKEKGKDAAGKYVLENIDPINWQATLVYMNIRFDALSALSLRIFVAGRMYLFLKTQKLLTVGNAFNEFISVYDRILTAFESDITKYLVDRDL
jgi:hypothetical protein